MSLVARKKHCLIADDSELIRRVVRHMLVALDFETSEAADGAATIARCRDAMPDVILLDWSMPALSGHALIESVRSEPDGHRPVVIYCTTENDVAEITRARRAGANDVILKPFDRQTLQAKLASAGLL